MKPASLRPIGQNPRPAKPRKIILPQKLRGAITQVLIPYNYLNDPHTHDTMVAQPEAEAKINDFINFMNKRLKRHGLVLPLGLILEDKTLSAQTQAFCYLHLFRSFWIDAAKTIGEKTKFEPTYFRRGNTFLERYYFFCRNSQAAPTGPTLPIGVDFEDGLSQIAYLTLNGFLPLDRLSQALIFFFRPTGHQNYWPVSSQGYVQVYKKFIDLNLSRLAVSPRSEPR